MLLKFSLKLQKNLELKELWKSITILKKMLKKHIRKSDKARAAYYKHISNRKWGDAKNYDLVFRFFYRLEESANIIVECFLNSKNK